MSTALHLSFQPCGELLEAPRYSSIEGIRPPLNHQDETMSSELPPPEMPDIWQPSDEFQVHYLVHTPWVWVMNQLPSDIMVKAETTADLPSSKVPVQATPGSGVTPAARRRRQLRKGLLPCTLKLDLVNPTSGDVEYSVHGTSSALDGVEDKDELVRTIQRCQCVEHNVCPPSILINWDASKEECSNVVGEALPSMAEGNTTGGTIAVLKEPMGAQGQGIYFVKSVAEIHQIIDDHHKRAIEDTGYLDRLIEAKGRIPSWVLQAEVTPSMLVRDRRKFHVRSYICIIEKPSHPDVVDLYLYNRHEIRVAGVPVSDDEGDRNRLAHITNGALSKETERVVLGDLEELKGRNLERKIEVFIAKTFARSFISDIRRRVQSSLPRPEGDMPLRKFALAGLDLMVTEDERIFLLEANLNPGAPSAETVNDAFTNHLTGFFHDLIDLVVGRSSPRFLNMEDILAQNGVQ